MRALRDPIISGTLLANGQPRPDWLRRAQPPELADVPTWLALRFAKVHGRGRRRRLVLGPLLGMQGDRIGVVCPRPVLRIRDRRLAVGCPSPSFCTCGAPADRLREWTAIVEALDLAHCRARGISSDQDLRRERELRALKLRAEADAAEPDCRAQLMANARKERHRAKTGEGTKRRAMNAEAAFVVTLRVGAPALPLEAVAQLARWVGVLPTKWRSSKSQSRRLELLEAGRFRRRTATAPASLRNEAAAA